MTYDVHVEGACIKVGVALEEAARFAGLDENDILWSIEEAGRCDGVGPDGHFITIVETGNEVDDV